jgi:transposase
MTVTPKVEADILRLHHVEKWKMGTIARQLHVHHEVVRRVLAQSGVPKPQLLPRPSMIDPYLSFILATLEKYPTLTASRLYEMVCARGYPGNIHHFRHLIWLYRPKPAAEAYLRLRTLPGEQAQVDWGHFGYLPIGKAKRPLMAFVMVLSYSRKIFLRFYLNAQMANFLRGHVAAFEAFTGIPKRLLYDNLKSAMLERIGDAIRFNPELLKFAAHYHYEPRPVAVARGNEKGRVERAIRYIRDHFFAARTFTDLQDLNAQARLWCEGPASHRPCPEDTSLSVAHVFEAEKPSLIVLPDHPYPTHERVEVNIGKTPYARFDLNDYSVPHTQVRRTLTVIAEPNHIAILDSTGKAIAHHPRSYDKGQQVEDERHIKMLIERKAAARVHRGQDRLAQAIPCAKRFLIKAAERHYGLGTIIRNLLHLLDRYGAQDLELGMSYALAKEVPHPNTVRLYLERQREEKHLLPALAIPLPNDVRVREQVIRPHSLADYAALEVEVPVDKQVEPEIETETQTETQTETLKGEHPHD